MKKCPKCGHKNDNDANFCSNCREKLEKKLAELIKVVARRKRLSL